jgi:hypothetical protein
MSKVYYWTTKVLTQSTIEKKSYENYDGNELNGLVERQLPIGLCVTN